MVWQIITMRVGMSIVPGRKIGLDLRMMRGMRMGMVHGMVLIQFTVPVLIRAGLGSGLGCLGIIRLAIRSVSGRH
jgi:hypothetical protein